MFIRFAPIAVTLSLFAVVACSAPAESLSSGEGALDSKTESDDDGKDGKGSSDDTADGGAASGDETADNGKGGKGGDEEPSEADPTCVATCNSSLKAKCEGDDKFCDGICEWVSNEMLTCLIAAPSCEKTEFIRCSPPDDGSDDDGSGSGDKGAGGK